MASQSGGFDKGGTGCGGKRKPTTSRMKQPSLIKQLQGILSDYPDGGQIIKELIQNAEDAGASTVEIMYDARNINQDSTNDKYSIFFKGPALFLYNDATFTELDWEGIKMIYSSVKEEDKLKVGRFGLGFKSVFHVTDYPSVLSGNNLLLINPHEHPDEVNTEFEVGQLNEYDGINKEECLKAFGGRFNISKDTLINGGFQGTIFRFPLRQEHSLLSDNVYTEKKVLDLFESFKKEASDILLFLKNIASIKITIQRGEQQFHEVATVELVENVDEVRNERKRFKHIIEGLGSKNNGQPVESFVRMKVQTTIHSQSQQTKKNTETWLVVNYFMGNNASTQFQKLIKDKSIGYSPYVGVAAPLTQQTDERFEGHEFCFLPLPREGRRQTGLPFHVNGFFSLSSNRHHIKWPTDEQKDTDITDKNILWNQCVIKEAVPLAYKILVMNATKCAEAGTPDPEPFTQIFPLINTTAENWKPFLTHFFDAIKDLPFLKVYRRHKWVTVSEACFATFRDLEQSDSDMKDHIVSTLLELQQPFVNISSDSFNTLHQFYGGIKDLDPCRFAYLLRNDMKCTYKKLPVETKLCILRYILSEANYDLIDGLELIPLASGSWQTFVQRKTSSKNILLQLEAYKQLTFPGLEENFVKIPDSLLQLFRNICNREMYNLKYQTDDDTVHLLAKLLSAQGNNLTEGSAVNLTWLEKVWMHFRSAVDKISHLPLVPLLREGTWEKPLLVELMKLNQMAIFKTSEGHEPLSDGLSYCLEKLSVTVLPSHPRWFPVIETSRFISQPSQLSVLKILEQLVQTKNIVDLAKRFNRHCNSPSLIKEFCSLMANSNFHDRHLVMFLQKLNIFCEKENDQGGHKLVPLESASHQKQYITCASYPVRYPKPYLIADTNNEQLLRKLGAYLCQTNDLVKSTLLQLMSGKYNKQERVVFMNYFISNFGKFEFSQDIINLAKTIEFVKCSQTPTLKRPLNIFDPSESLLKRLFTEDMFPEDTRPDRLVVLKKLGLKSVSDLIADDVKAVAVSLDKDTKQHINNNERATSLLEVLNIHPTLLDQRCTSGRVLKTELEHLQWVPVVKTPPDVFPRCIPWYTHLKILYTPREAVSYNEWYRIIGSTVPTITGASDIVSKHFRWNNDPPIEKIVQQLSVISKHYNKKYHSEIVLIIKTIYQFLNLHRAESKSALSFNDLVWCGDKFVSSALVIVKKNHEDVDMVPYFYFMQDEFAYEFHDLFTYIGCHVKQDINVLIDCLHKVNDKHQHDQGIYDDLALVIRILEKLQLVDANELSTILSQVLIPVNTRQGIVVLKSPTECVFTEGEDLYDEEDEKEYLFVHDSVTGSMVKAFGIKSLTRHVLDEAEGLDVEEWGQEEPLTTRLNSLLREGYKDGLSVPKELVQNADDAKAITVKILYDERENRDNMKRLLNKGMAQCQGPALWFYNDAAFTEEDFANIIKLNGATKRNEVGKIGKFGLGFCSVYNLTDVPSFFSNQTFVFFDPHKTYLGEALPGMSSGMKISLRSQKRNVLLRKYRDQFLPFQDVYGCVFSGEENSCNGTLFRFPLRTEHQSTVSKIKQMAYTKEEVAKLLRMFIETAGDMMLFTQHIEKVEIHHLGPQGQPGRDEVCIFAMEKRVRIENMITHNQRYVSILQRNDSVSEIQTLDLSIELFDEAKRVIADINTSNIKCTWIVSWSTGENEAKSLANRKEDRRALPLAAVAVPCDSRGNLQPYPLDQLPSGFHKSGRLFCFLPLPLECGLNMHINAYFDVTSDRRQLLSDSEDDKSTQSHQWNRALMTDAAVNALLKLLVKVVATSSLESYYRLWPITRPRFTDAFVVSLYKQLVSSNLHIFKGEGNGNLRFSDVMFIDPRLTEDKAIGKLCFRLLRRFPPRQDKHVIDIPSPVLRLLRELNGTTREISVVESAIIGEEEFILTFLNSIDNSFWQDDLPMRNALIMFALKPNSDPVKQKIKTTDCVPTRPYGRLRKPCELVKEHCSVASLFSEDDERFLIKDSPFTRDIEYKLTSLGMIENKLPSSLLRDRCLYITHCAETCCVCAYDFSLKLIQYLCRQDIASDLNADRETREAVCNEYILPVLNKPEHWNIPWYAEECKNVKTFSSFCQNHTLSTRKQFWLGQPQNLFRQKTQNIVGCVELVVDERDYKPTYPRIDALRYLGVRQDVNFKTVVKQLRAVTDNYARNTVEHDDMLKSCLNEIYSTLFSKLTTEQYVGSIGGDEMRNDLMTFSNCPVVLIEGELIKPCNVALQLKSECHPCMFSLPKDYTGRLTPLFEAFGVKKYFLVDDVLHFIQQERSEWKDKACTNIDKIFKLLQNLEDSMTREGSDYNDLQDRHSQIIAPDEDGHLWPTRELVIDDEDFPTNQTVHILHRNIPRGLGEALGVIPKQRKCRANISRGIPFGQKEELVTRLRGLLKAYPCDSGIMKELIQNADDAGATEICFITDFSTHKEDHRFGCKMLNQPSLCVYNNSSFTEQDLQGIHNLGRGSKGDDPTKTGQYGVGFNAVYHLTDIPSFMTVGADLPNDGAMCIFDPLCKHIKDVSKHEPGIRSEVNGLKSDFPDIISGFHADKLLSNGVGTVFRFPLRQQKSDISAEIITEDKMKDIIEQLKTDMFDVLLFVKNVTCIKIMDMSSGDLEQKYEVRLQLSEQDRLKLNSFHSYISQAATINKDSKLKNLQIPSREVQYKALVSDSQNCSRNWLIVQKFGVNEPLQEKVHQQLSEAFSDGNIGLLPIGGIAFPIDNLQKLSTSKAECKQMEQTQDAESCTKDRRNGRAFCFLPLPVKSGLPVHINGHFALDHEARRDLWKDGYRKRWNDFILNHVVVPAWITGIISLQKLYVERLTPLSTSWKEVNNLLQEYHSFFPRTQTKETYSVNRVPKKQAQEGLLSKCVNFFQRSSFTRNPTEERYLTNNVKMDQAEESYWEKCVRFFYDNTLSDEKIVFPFVQQSETRKTNFSISWHPLQSPTSQIIGVFNDIESKLPLGRSEDSFRRRRIQGHIITNTLKGIGMKLLETPMDIYRTLKSFKFEAAISSPDYVITFLRTFDKDSGCCNIGPINGPIHASNFKDHTNLRHLVYFLQLDHDFPEKINGLPILLTADGTIRQCSTKSPVFESEYQDLLPRSSDMFLHESLSGLIPSPSETLEAEQTKDKEKVKDPVVMKLTVDKFVELLPKSCKESHYRSGNKVPWTQGCLVCPRWICRLFQFLFRQDQTLQENLMKLSSWSFLPSVEYTNRNYLIPIELFYTLYKSTSSDEEDRVLKELHLPRLDTEVLKELTTMKDGIAAMDQLVSSCSSIYNPELILKCLKYHNTNVSRIHIPPESAKLLLSYLNRHLDVLKEKCTTSLQKDLCSLPMFVTIQNTVVSVSKGHSVYVLPRIPSQGIGDWANEENVILLQDSELFKKLLEYLGLTVKDSWTFYVEKLLPSIRAMPANHWKVHIAFVRDRYNAQNETEQEKAKQLLKGVPFIKSKRANDYYYHAEPVFQCFLPSTSFLPDEYRKSYWVTFLEELGLQVSVDDTQFEDFARQIERDSNNLNKDIVNKSFLLVNNLIYRDKSPSFLQRIRNIRFVTPYKVEKSLSEHCPQFENAARLICFEGSVNENKKRLCWTSAPLTQKAVVEKLNKETIDMLGIHSKPPLDFVIEHCSQISLSFSLALQGNKDSSLASFVQDQMFLFYHHFSDQSINKRTLRIKLKHIPTIYLPQVREMVIPERTIIELHDDDQMMPYVYKLPREYGRYIDFFTSLGSLGQLTCQKLASILDEIHEKYEDKEVVGSDFGVVAKVMSLFLDFLQRTDFNEFTCQIPQLFLPNLKNVLCNSNDIYVDDITVFRSRCDLLVHLNWFIGCEELRISIPNESEVLRKLPTHIQPTFISDIVTEKVCVDNMQTVECRQLADCLEAFLQSPELLEGLIRLVKHNMPVSFKKELIEIFKMRLQHIRCVQVINLQTVLEMNGEMLEQSKEGKKCHINSSNENYITFYFQFDEETDRLSDLVKIHDGLFHVVQRYVTDEAGMFHVLAILDFIEMPDKIRSYLDSQKIQSYKLCLQRCAQKYPTPGTYVEDKLIPFITHDLRPFQVHEYKYAVMEFRQGQDTHEEEQETTYKYVHIVHRAKIDGTESNSSPLDIVYKVDCGDEIVHDVQIWLLYRFVKPDEEIDFGNTPKDEAEFQQCCRDVYIYISEAWKLEITKRDRIIKRMLLHWCHGLNLDNEYARRVYNYIRQTIIELENGHEVSSSICSETGMVAPDTRGSFIHNMCQSVQHDSRQHVERYQSNRSQYRTYRHTSASAAVRPDISEANRWLKQASIDYKAACTAFETMTEVQGDNWTCYKCHQASEKAMKAVLYSINANKVPNNVASHDLTLLASGLSVEIQHEARLLMGRLGDQSQLRYPNAVNRDRIPSDMYNKDAADFALEHTKIVIELAKEAI